MDKIICQNCGHIITNDTLIYKLGIYYFCNQDCYLNYYKELLSSAK